MKRIALAMILLTFALPALTRVASGQIQDSQRNDRFSLNLIEPDGFLGLRLGNSFRFAEEQLGEANSVGKGSLQWHFTDAAFDPYQSLTVVGDKRKIDGFDAVLRPNRIQFTDLKLHPEKDRLGTWHASRTYTIGKYEVRVTVMSNEPTYARRIILLSIEKALG
jgi:hypothetical protein